MRIDKARRYDQPVGVDGPLGAFRHLPDLGNLAIRYGDIGLVTLGAGAINHGAVLDDEIVAHRLFPPGRNLSREYIASRPLAHAKNTGLPPVIPSEATRRVA